MGMKLLPIMNHLEKRRFPFTRLQRFLDPLVILAAVATAPIIVLQTSGHTSPAIVTIDWLIWAVFVIDFIVSVAAGKGPRFRLVLDTLIVVTSFPLLPDPLSSTRLIRLTRLFRVIRVVAVARSSRSRSSRHGGAHWLSLRSWTRSLRRDCWCWCHDDSGT